MGRVKGDSGEHCPVRGRSLTFGSKIRHRARGQALRHEDGIGAAAVRVGIIGAAFASLGKASGMVEGDGRGVIGGDFKEGVGGVALAGLGQELADKVPCSAHSAGIGGNGEGEEFGFPRNSAGDKEGMGGGQKVCVVTVQHGGEFEGGPWAGGGKA